MVQLSLGCRATILRCLAHASFAHRPPKEAPEENRELWIEHVSWNPRVFACVPLLVLCSELTHAVHSF
jgi:hypothetical protein